MGEKAVILLSGGLDSSTLLYSQVNNFECYPLTIIYGQRHQKEIIAARNICEARDTNLLHRWKLIDLGILSTVLPSTLTGVGDIPEGHYADESMKATVVPNRNMILIAIAGGYAAGLGAKVLAYAPHKGDFSVYPDCRPVFIESARTTLRLATGWNNDGVMLSAPFSDMTKADIVKLGTKLNVPYKVVWSCYVGKERPCLRCGTCVERTMAFEHNGLKDPALTESEWQEAIGYAKSVGGDK